MEFVIALLVIAVLVFAMLSMIAGVALIIGVIWLGLVIIQLILGAVLKKITGKTQYWLMSKKTFTIEAVIALVVALIYFNTPVNSGDLIPDECASISYSTVNDDGGNRSIVHSEQLDAMMDLLESFEVRRRLNLRFINEGAVMHDNGGIFLYLRDENGDLLKKIRIYGDLFGVAKKEDGDFVYYRAEGAIDEYPFQQVMYLEKRENVYDVYAEELTDLSNSWDYADGIFTFTIPEWSTDDWSLSIDAKIAVLDENGRKVDTDYITYLEDRCEANDWAANETVSFSILDAPHESLSYTVKVEGYSFETMIRLSAIDEQYVYPEHEG